MTNYLVKKKLKLHSLYIKNNAVTSIFADYKLKKF